MEIARALLRDHYISNLKILDDTGPQGTLRLYLKYQGVDRSVITGIKRVSTPGRRVYVGKQDVPRVLGGLGSSILTTSQGHHDR